jgi:DNA-binding CsgD family transcriptional regulator
MPASTSAGFIVGRRDALDSVAEFLRGIDAGPAALILEGEPGIGKTTLWQAGIDLAIDLGYRVFSTRPTESEAKLSHVGLGDLLEGAIDGVLTELPEPQRRALDVTLLRVEAGVTPVDHRTLSVACLNAVRALATACPLLIAIDDLQWLDPPTASILAFIARRLREGPARFLVSVRRQAGTAKPAEVFDGLGPQRVDSVELERLQKAELGRILRDRFGSGVPKEALDRAAEASAGNAFWAIEIARGLLASRLKVDGASVTLSPDLAELVPNHIGELPSSTQDLLLLCAAASAPSTALLRSVSATPDRVSSELEEAVAAGVVEVEGELVRFSHPLLSSSVYSQASPGRRRDAHARLANALTDPEERARHLGLASDGPDLEVAAALEDGARTARSRGAPTAAGELLEMALGLTPPDRVDDARRRGIEAAECFTLAEDFDKARRLSESVLTSAHEGPQRAEALWRLARVCDMAGDISHAAQLLTEAIEQQGVSHGLKSSVHQWRAWVAASEPHLEEAEREAEAAVAEAELAGEPARLQEALLALALIRFRLGYGTQWPLLERASELESSVQNFMVSEQPRYWVASYLFTVGDLDEARRIYVSCLDAAEARGDEASTQDILTFLGALEQRAGDWPQALDHLANALALAPDRPLTLGVRALVYACTGELETARADAQRVFARAAIGGVRGFFVIDAHHALGLVELSRGDLNSAISHFREAWNLARETDENDPDTFPFVADEIEVLVTLGQLKEADSRLEWLEERGRTLDRALALATGARCRGLLLAARSDLPAALASLEEALRYHERLPMPFELARTLLVQGTIRRRAKQKRTAREALERALAIFEELGAPLWAEKARSELARVSGRRPGGGDLTEAERRVARLAAAGRTNKEIAESLFMSPRTVGGHLSHIYAKLGIRSRTELAGLSELVKDQPLHS